ncbi:protein starmaker [Condylostylus longicornis]|uniref:protein starmaker n=1 Tax=Condylostylus longicornis TaxID=2530218 RepID=UPI00244DBEB7|nr:protein starmaker [Condylostylus longicornis]
MGRLSLWVLFGLVLFAVSFNDAQVSAEVGPTESQCKPYIEKAIKELQSEKDGDDDDGPPSGETIGGSTEDEGAADDDGVDSKEDHEADENDDEEQNESGDVKTVEVEDDDDGGDSKLADDDNDDETEAKDEDDNGTKEETDDDTTAEKNDDEEDEATTKEEDNEQDDIKSEEAAEEKSGENQEDEDDGDKDDTTQEKGDDEDDHDDEDTTQEKIDDNDDDDDKDENVTHEQEGDEDDQKSTEGKADDEDDDDDDQQKSTEAATDDEDDDKDDDVKDDTKEEVDDMKSEADDDEDKTKEKTDADEDEDATKEKVDEEDDGTKEKDDDEEEEDATKEKDDDEQDDDEDTTKEKEGEDDEHKDEASKETAVAEDEESLEAKDEESKEQVKDEESKEAEEEHITSRIKRSVGAGPEEDDTTQEKTDDDDGDDEEASKEKDDEGEEEDEEDDGESKETRPEDDLLLEAEIPEHPRDRSHINELLHLDDEYEEQEHALDNVAEVILRDIKRIYENAVKPLETLYKYRDLSNRHFSDPEIFSKPLILFMGPWSGGKSSIINYLTDNEFKSNSLRTGAEPSPAYFNILMWGNETEVLDGTQLAADYTFSGLQKFGQGLEERLRGLKMPNPLLEKVNIVEIPGILEVRKQVSRLFPFNDACQWFIDRADIIFLIYDPAKLDVGPETEAILDQLKGREYQTRILLNKADTIHPDELLRVQSALIWNISPLMSSAQPPVMYTTSLWSHPYEPNSPVRLLQAQERAFLRDLRTAIEKRIENRIASARRFAVRVRNHAKMVDCYLNTYYNHKTIFGNKKKISDQIIENPQNYHIYEGLSTLTNISRYDLPDPDVYRDFFRLNPLYEFKKLSETCTYFRGCPIQKLDVAIAYDLPELVGKYKKMAEQTLNKLDSTSHDNDRTSKS